MRLSVCLSINQQTFWINTEFLLIVNHITKLVSFEMNPLLRWLDWIFWGGYLPSLSINYVGISKDMEKRLPQLYYIEMKISYDLGFIAIRVAMATWWRHYDLYLSLCFSVPGFFLFTKSLNGVCTFRFTGVCKFGQILWVRAFGNIFCYPHN